MSIRNAISELAKKWFMLLTLSMLSMTVAADSAGIQIPTRQEAQRVNQHKIGVVFTHEELFHQLVHNMEDELEHDSGLRIVPIMGKNHVQSVYDLLYLKGVDLALVRADAIEYVKRVGNYPTIQRKVQSVAKVSEEKILVIARNDYQSLEELDGQVVGFGLPGSGEFVTSTIAFDTLGLKPEYIEVNNSIAIEKMKSGELAAMVYLLREPDAVQTGSDLEAANAVKNLTLSDELHLIEIPENDALSEIYTPSVLTSAELPGLIEQGKTLATYSVDAILAAYYWAPSNDRQAQSQRFVNAFVAGLEGLQTQHYQPAWKRVDLALDTRNVTRSPLVKSALDARDLDKKRLVEAKKAAKEQAVAEAKAVKIAELVKRRNDLTTRIGNELNQADTEKLELMLEELDSFLDERE